MLRRMLVAATVGIAALAPAAMASASTKPVTYKPKFTFTKPNPNPAKQPVTVGAGSLAIVGGTVSGSASITSNLEAGGHFFVEVVDANDDPGTHLVLCSFVANAKGAGKCAQKRATPLLAGTGMPVAVDVVDGQHTTVMSAPLVYK